MLTIILLGGLLAAETLHNTGNTSATIIPEIDYTVEQAQRLLAVDAVTAATSSEDGGSNYRLHRILGYLTMGGVVASGLLGWLTPGDLHAGVGIGTTGLATVTSGLAILDFARGGSLPLPHVILTGLGTVGFAANLFIEPGEEEGSEGSNLHSILGAASVGAFALGVSWVIAY
ncbi:MAG: hypothetical protein K9L66_05435 [Spirochaetaceae bacterium]|nr:hypothetical protein [Spirochaetaceae bacterium]